MACWTSRSHFSSLEARAFGTEGAEPPDTGRHTAAWRSTNWRKSQPLRSYHPCPNGVRMNIWRRIPIGGWAPYVSLKGMFKSSMKSWHWFAVVWAEKAKAIGLYLPELKPSSSMPWIEAIFAVPVGPLNRILKPCPTTTRIRNWLRTVSEVGTTIVWYGASLGTSKPARM